MITVIIRLPLRISNLPFFSKSHFLFLPPLRFVHFLNLLFNDANRLIQPLRVATHPLDFHRRKPFAGVRCWLAQRLEMPGPHQKRQVIIRPPENARRRLHAHARRSRPSVQCCFPFHTNLSVRDPSAVLLWAQFIFKSPRQGGGPLLDFRFVFLKREPNAQQQCQVRRRQRPVLAGLHQLPEHFQFSRFHQGTIYLQAIGSAVAAATRRRLRIRITFLFHMWENSHGLDESSAPVRRLIGSGWSWFMPPAIQARCASLSPTQWPHTGSSSYSALQCVPGVSVPLDSSDAVMCLIGSRPFMPHNIPSRSR